MSMQLGIQNMGQTFTAPNKVKTFKQNMLYEHSQVLHELLVETHSV